MYYKIRKLGGGGGEEINIKKWLSLLGVLGITIGCLIGITVRCLLGITIWCLLGIPIGCLIGIR